FRRELIHHRFKLVVDGGEGLVTTRVDPAVSGSARCEASPEKSKAAMAGVLPSPTMRDRGDRMISATTPRHEGRLEQPISKDVSLPGACWAGKRSSRS